MDKSHLKRRQIERDKEEIPWPKKSYTIRDELHLVTIIDNSPTN